MKRLYGKEQKYRAVIIIYSVIFIALIVLCNRMFVSNAFAENRDSIKHLFENAEIDGTMNNCEIVYDPYAKKPTKIADYIKYLPENTKIDWSKDRCDKRDITDPITKKAVVSRCKVEHSTKSYSFFSTYLMVNKKDLIYIPKFLITNAINLGEGSALVLYSDSYALHMLLVFDKDNQMVCKYIIDNEPSPNKKSTGLAYKGLLMWDSDKISKLSNCALDVMKTFSKAPKRYSSFYNHVPIQIKVIRLPETVTGITDNVNKDDAIKDMVDKTVAMVLSRNKDKNDDIFEASTFGERLFAYLAANSPNNKVLNAQVHKYRKYIGKKILALYEKMESCK